MPPHYLRDIVADAQRVGNQTGNDRFGAAISPNWRIASGGRTGKLKSVSAPGDRERLLPIARHGRVPQLASDYFPVFAQLTLVLHVEVLPVAVRIQYASPQEVATRELDGHLRFTMN